MYVYFGALVQVTASLTARIQVHSDCDETYLTTENASPED